MNWQRKRGLRMDSDACDNGNRYYLCSIEEQHFVLNTFQTTILEITVGTSECLSSKNGVR